MICKKCGAEKEDLEHFILYCPSYQEIINKNQIFDQPYNKNCLGDILFENKEHREEIKNSILEIWKKKGEKLRKARDQP